MKKISVFVFAWLASALMLVGQFISVASPNGGEHLKLGAKHTIEWTSCGLTSGTLKITLWKGSSNVGIIASGVPCSLKTYDWTVGNLEGAPGAAPAFGYTIKVKWQEQSLVDESDAPFTITAGDARDFNLKWLPGVLIDPATGSIGEVCSFTARFLVEKGTLQRATVHCLIQPEGVNQPLLIGSQSFQNIAPGNPVPVTVQWRAERMGEHQVLFRFDADIRPLEPAANRSDNRIGATFRVRGVPAR